ncbi:peptidase domain-containing ABC transporter [Brevibacillus sp. SYSU BS000544]|uniref:peptidase domain-containing ABC transporter n=1 Tax=Brevibacillus sp. SYSU BS000544 TaxID=3416443 RepID=UPI003CE588F5
MKNKWRVPFVEQMEQSECGICCLAMIMGYYKSYVPLHELRDRCGAGRDGVNLLTLKKIAHAFGLQASGKKVSIEQLESLKVPAILYWDNNHFVVLEKVQNGSYTILDPAIGRRKVARAEMIEKFSGVVLEMVPTADFIRYKKRFVWKEYILLLATEPTLVTSIIVWSLWLQLLALVTPIAIRYLIDEVILSKEYSFLPPISIGMLALSIVYLLIAYSRARFLVNLQNKLDGMLMSRFFFKLLKLPYQFFQTRTTGDLIVRANSNMMVRDVLSSSTVGAILDGGLVVFFLLYMVNQSPMLTGWVVCIGLLQIMILIGTSQYIKRLSQEQIIRQTAASSSFLESLRGIHVVKSEGFEDLAFSRWHGLYQEQLSAMKRRGIAEAVVESLVNSLRFGAPLLLLFIGIQEVIAYRMTLGEFFAFFSLAMGFLVPLTSFVSTLNQMIVLGAYLNRILDIHDAKTEQDDASVIPVPQLSGAIELQNVDFHYTEHSPAVIRNVSISISPGQKVAIVGASGAGKSTLACLLLGLYQPTSGKVMFDGLDVSRLDKPQLRQQIGVVMQHTFLFHRTIAENIALHNPALPFDQIVRVAKLAGIHDDIMKMPMKYNTLLSETGSNISGGQRQRLALARALAHDPAILLLDEATSSLDQLTERIVDLNLSNLSCTRVVIAHRLSTIINADLIIVVDQGAIVEQGTHEELLLQNRVYASIYQGKQKEEEMQEWKGATG